MRRRRWPIRPSWAMAAAGSEGERRREVQGSDPWPQLGQRRPEVAWPLGRAAVSGSGRDGTAVELGGGQEEREKEEGAEGDLLPTLARAGMLRWGRSTVAGGRRAELRAAAALGLGRRRGSWWWWLRSSEAGQGPLYSRGKAVGRVERGGGGRRAARSAFNGAPAACSCRGAAARAARPVRGEGTARAGLASGPAALWLTVGGATSSAACGRSRR